MLHTKKLATIVSEELNAAPVIEEFLLSGLANITAISIVLRPLIVSRLGKRVSPAAIGMALRRYKARTKRTVPIKKRFPSSIEIRPLTSLVEIGIRKDGHTLKRLQAFQHQLTLRGDEICTIAHGAYEVVILAHQRHTKRIYQSMRDCRFTSEVTQLGCVTVDWPSTTKDIPGIYYRVTRALSRREISIQSFHTIGSEMMILVREDVLPQAYTTIRQLLSNSEFE